MRLSFFSNWEAPRNQSLRGAFLFLALNIGFSLSLDFLLLLIYNLSPFTEGSGKLTYDYYP